MTINLYDLGQIVTIVFASMSSVMALFQLLRTLFLDSLTQKMPSDQRDTLYRTLVWLILTAIITVLAMMNSYTLSVTLVLSAGMAAFPLLVGVHFVYTKLQKPAPLSSYNIPAANAAKIEAPVPSPAE